MHKTDAPCTCFDCTVYFNENTNRPIKANDITDEEFNELIDLCSKDAVIEKMKSERYKNEIYEIVPFQLWGKLQNKETYDKIFEELKSSNKIPDEQPKICHIGSCIENNNEAKLVSYRFPTSTATRRSR